MKVEFTKMHGTGNDFVLVDEWDGEVISEKAKPNFVERISERHTGVGSDGVIFIQKSEGFDAKFVFYNPDGSVAEMCGNGIRCFAKYIYEKGHVEKTEMSVETSAGVKYLKLTLFNDTVEQVRVDMGAPQIKRGEAQVAGDPEDTFIDQEVIVGDTPYRLTAVGMGNPHAILFLDELDFIEVVSLGGKIRNLKRLFPNGVNVQFTSHKENNEFNIRTFERGVEDETLACGTGICAAAVAAVLNKKADPRKAVKFNAPGGRLSAELELDGEGNITKVYLVGPAIEVFKGVLKYNLGEA
ncbi:MAG: diaminopimelate epimerase [Methanobacteriota archaeon]